ncbi:hypothetical protein ACS7SF_10070 [Ralstonia sp. 25C]|uniref:hypothetical protein n=1 Tax=Ralstonia sp. 25C TaxID=3447363 RepID=UPI003F74EABB
MGRTAKAFGNGILFRNVYEYAESVEDQGWEEFVQMLKTPRSDLEREYLKQPPKITLAMVDLAVAEIAQHPRAPSARFSFVDWPSEEIPFEDVGREKLLSENARAFRFYAILRAFYGLLFHPEYRALNYCASIEAARQALLAVYGSQFEHIPDTEFPLRDGVTAVDLRKAITQLAGAAAQRFNRVVDIIAAMVCSREYRHKVTKERNTVGRRIQSVTTLINGLLAHHGQLTVVAVRLSIRERDGLHFFGEKRRKAWNCLIGDRRNDVLLDSAVGFFWVLHERVKFGLHERLPTIRQRNAEGTGVALHYDLVMFFDSTRSREVDAIAKHIGTCWRVVTDGAGFHKALHGKSLIPAPVSWWLKEGEPPPVLWDADFVGLVERNTREYDVLQKVVSMMVASATLCKPLVKDKSRRLGKSDLLTGCGLGKPGRGAKSDHPDTKHQRPRRPRYVPELKSRWE